MLDVWNRELRKYGLPNLYVIGEVAEPSKSYIDGLDAGLIRFPDYAMRHMTPTRLENGLALYDYNAYWDILLEHDWKIENDSKIYLSAAVDYDSTPRRGVNGWMLHGANVESFHAYFRKFIKMNSDMGNTFIFINAWNEWGEGMYLEPDVENGYGYLYAIKAALEESDQPSNLLQEKELSVEHDDRHRKEFNAQSKTLSQSHTMRTLSNWLDLWQKGKTILPFFHKNNYRKIAIYGYGYLGKHLMKELASSDVEVGYIIDRNPLIKTSSYRVYSLCKDLPPVDAIIVTPAGQYGTIRHEIHKCIPDAITVSIEHIISEFL